MGLALGAGHVQLGRGKTGGQRIQLGTGVGLAAQDFQQAATRVGAVVEAEPALLEEDVPAHLAAQGRVHLLHARLDQRVTGLVHLGHAAGFPDGWRQALRALHVEQNGAARHARQHVLGKQHHLAVGVNGLAILGDDAQAVAVAVKGQAQLGIRLLQRTHHVAQVLGLAGVGVVVGEGAIHLREQLQHLAAQGAEDARRRGTGHAIAAIDHHLDRATELHITHDARRVRFQHIGLAHLATAGQRPVLGLDGLAQGLDLGAIDGPTGQHHLETVVILGVVAASHHDAAGAQGAGRKVQHGRGAHAHVQHVDARLDQPGHQCLAERRAGQATIAPHGHHPLTLGQGSLAKGPPDTARYVLVQRRRHDAANVVGLEDGSSNLHSGVLSVGSAKKTRHVRRACSHILVAASTPSAQARAKA